MQLELKSGITVGVSTIKANPTVGEIISGQLNSLVSNISGCSLNKTSSDESYNESGVSVFIWIELNELNKEKKNHFKNKFVNYTFTQL